MKMTSNAQLITPEDYSDRYYTYHLTRYQNQDAFIVQRVNLVMSSVQPTQDDIIVDAGCGIGVMSIEAAKLGASVIGIDYSINALLFLKRLLKEEVLPGVVAASCSRVDYIPLSSHSVDKIISADLIEHLYSEESEKFLGECNRVLKAGGLFLLITPNPVNVVNCLPNWVQASLKKFHMLYLELLGKHQEQAIHRKVREHHAEFGKLHVSLKPDSWILERLSQYNFNIVNKAYFNTLVGLISRTIDEKLPNSIKRYFGGDIAILVAKSEK